jgi:ADP-heptose:LPS heptosyltransferase
VVQKRDSRPDCFGCNQYETESTAYNIVSQPSSPELLATAENIGIVEMGGLGSLMRTTAVTRAIREVNERAQITWFTHSRGANLLQYVPGVTPVDIETVEISIQEDIASEQDVIINFEMSGPAKNILLHARKVGGFALNQQGRFCGISPETEYFQRFQIDDSFRLANQLTMQQILLNSIGLGERSSQYEILLRDENYEYANDFLGQVFSGRIPEEIIGLNIGTSHRGRVRRWPVEYHATLAKQLSTAYSDRGVLILNGPDDHEVRSRFIEHMTKYSSSNLVLTPNSLEIGNFMALVGKIDILVTSNSFALHVAKSQKVPVVTFDNPLPPQEIEVDARDVLITPKLGCGPCFNKCTQSIEGKCMSEVSVLEVARGIERVLAARA